MFPLTAAIEASVIFSILPQTAKIYFPADKFELKSERAEQRASILKANWALGVYLKQVGDVWERRNGKDDTTKEGVGKRKRPTAAAMEAAAGGVGSRGGTEGGKSKKARGKAAAKTRRR